MPTGIYWLNLIRGPRANEISKKFTTFYMKIATPQSHPELTRTLSFDTKFGIIKNTYIRMEFTDEENPDLQSNIHIRWIPYITVCKHTIHIIRLKRDLIHGINIHLTTLPTISIGRTFNSIADIPENQEQSETRSNNDIRASNHSPWDTHTREIAEPLFNIYISETNIAQNSTLATILKRLNGTNYKGNIYIKQKIKVLHNYYVMDASQTPTKNGLLLNIRNERQWFKLIPGISAKFPPIYKFLILANANNEWVNISGREEHWYILRPTMPVHHHSKLLSLLD